MSQLLNPNPEISDVSQSLRRTVLSSENEFEDEPIDEMEIFDLIRDINDPEHPLTLEQLKVISLSHIDISQNLITIHFTPTITHCSLATLIGLSLRVKLLRSLPARYKIDIKVTPGSYQSEDALNKQLNDKERVAAAMENGKLLSVVNKCIGWHLFRWESTMDRLFTAQRTIPFRQALVAL